MDSVKKVLFFTGTRADFGKLKPLIRVVEQSNQFDCSIFVTGMHMLARYGSTVDEVKKAGFRNIHTYINQYVGEPTDLVLANTVQGLAEYVHEHSPDLIIVHGDRIETLAGAIVGSLRNVLVAHVEGGEVSGTVDELLRHAVTKLSHIHFVANADAAMRLAQLGENKEAIHVIGSPDIDVMFSEGLPTIREVKQRYGIPFEDYGVLLFHPVTTELAHLTTQAYCIVDSILESGRNFIVIYPNNDEGCEDIFRAYRKFDGCERIRLFPSMRFEYFLTLLREASFIVGNSSAGVREAPSFPTPSINIGTRQRNRCSHDSIINIDCNKEQILQAIETVPSIKPGPRSVFFGEGNSASRFIALLSEPRLWNTGVQKQFSDFDVAPRSMAVDHAGLAQVK